MRYIYDGDPKDRDEVVRRAGEAASRHPDTSEEALRARATELYIEEVEAITARAITKGVSTVDVRIIDAALEHLGRKIPN